MREDLEQQEQLDAIKGFWKDNRRWIVPLLTVVVVGAAGFNVWNWYAQRQALEATQALAAMEQALGEQNLEKAKSAYKALSSDYGSSAQAALGGLQYAKALYGSGDLPQARTVLAGVVKNANEEFAWIARIRLAGVMLDEGNPKDALDVISAKPPKAFAALAHDRKGDVHVALGQKEEARSAWRLAMEGLAVQSPTRELVLRKLQTLDAFPGASNAR